MAIVLVLLDPEPVAVRRLLDLQTVYDSGMTRTIRARCLLDAHWLARGYRSICHGDKLADNLSQGRTLSKPGYVHFLGNT